MGLGVSLGSIMVLELGSSRDIYESLDLSWSRLLMDRLDAQIRVLVFQDRIPG